MRYSIAERRPRHIPILGRLRRHINLARESFAAPVEVNFALLRADQSLNYARAKPMARRRHNERAATLGPPKDKSFTACVRPFDLNMAFGHRQRTVFGGVGRKLMYTHRNRLSRLRIQ